MKANNASETEVRPVQTVDQKKSADGGEKKATIREVLTIPVLVAGLGYFVDMFALTLFGVVRQESVTKGLGIVDPEQALLIGKSLYSWQMIGMMVGGLLWGLFGDFKGRLSVLFGSILVYSLGNFANAFVTTPLQYEICRFLTGVGLAGELGAAITLIAEILPKNSRGLGTTIVATLGLFGAVCAALVGFIDMRWDHAYLMSGAMGVALLFMRANVFESGMFDNLRAKNTNGNPFERLLRPLGTILFSKRILRYLACIFIGAPIYFITGTLMTFAPEITKALGIENVSAASALLWGTIGLTVGDLVSGLLSQKLRSRRISIGICLGTALALTLIYLLKTDLTAKDIYVLCSGIGVCAGYWAVLVTTTAEQFGTNLRATATTTVPNFVRGMGALLLQLFVIMKGAMPTQQAAVILTLGVFGMAFLSLLYLKESFSQELDFVE
jgi:MFS family permease